MDTEFDARFVRFFQNLGFLFNGHGAFDNSKLQTALQGVQELSAMVAFKPVPPLVVVLINADSLSNEALIGRFVLLEDRIAAFREFAIRAGYAGQIAVVANVFVIFKIQSRCADYRMEAQTQCKKVHFLRKFHVLPWAIDLEAKHVYRHDGWPFRFIDFLSEEKLESRGQRHFQPGTGCGFRRGI